jgi:hypothetical protein
VIGVRRSSVPPFCELGVGGGGEGNKWMDEDGS